VQAADSRRVTCDALPDTHNYARHPYEERHLSDYARMRPARSAVFPRPCLRACNFCLFLFILFRLSNYAFWKLGDGKTWRTKRYVLSAKFVEDAFSDSRQRTIASANEGFRSDPYPQNFVRRPAINLIFPSFDQTSANLSGHLICMHMQLSNNDNGAN
jgi:hypothetical protein